MPASENFIKAFNKLNPAQREAVSVIEGPVMVVAGPGTGKTQILALRIANILLETDTKPGQILALTFTESGVDSMRKRLLEIIGTPAYKVVIGTFHRFCNDVIGRYPEYFPRIVGAGAITEIDQIKLLEKIIDELPLAAIRPFGERYHYVRPILAALNSLKREGIGPEEFAQLVTAESSQFKARTDLYHEKGAHRGKMKSEHKETEKRLAKNVELSLVYAAYQERLAAEHGYDFNDMILEVVRALAAEEDLRLTLQETHQYFLVDEHQDTNRAQNKVLELLASFHDNPNIFVVGDEKQAIYRFQGASLENFLYFKNIYPSAKLIVLEDNYRSTQIILDAAHSLLQSQAEIGPGLRSNAGYDEKPVRLARLSALSVEGYYVARQIEVLINNGVSPEEIAVLYRDNRDAGLVLPWLERLGIAAAVESDEDVLSDPEIKKLLALLEAVYAYSLPGADVSAADEKVAAALHLDFFNIDPLDIFRLIVLARQERRSVVESMSRSVVPSIAIAAGKLGHYASASRNLNLTQFLELVIRDSGFLASQLNRPDGVERMDRLNTFFDSIQALLEREHGAGLAEFFNYLKLLTEHGLLLKAGRRDIGGKVRLMTAHRSKGLEFDHVFITQAVDGHWGNKHRSDLLPLPEAVYSLTGQSLDKNDNNDERRLFYVALTRARREITITCADSANGREVLPSQFVTELNPALCTEVDAGPVEAEFKARQELLFAPALVSGTRPDDHNFVRAVFSERGFSVTALNNYLSCPWKYFYSNLLRVPQAKRRHQMYGTAVHSALKSFIDKLQDEGTDREYLLSQFEDALKLEPLTDRDFAETLAKGRKALSGYFDTYDGTWHSDNKTEVAFNDIVIAPDIRLTGKIDKIEILAAGRGGIRMVNVVDYKTGKHKSRGEILGTTKTSNGDLKRQLTFYKLLLAGSDSDLAMASGEIDFVEPNESGKYRREKLVITDEEVVELEELIKLTVAEILGLSFWDHRCDDADCPFCALRFSSAIPVVSSGVLEAVGEEEAGKH